MESLGKRGEKEGFIMETEQWSKTLPPRLVLEIHRTQNVDGFTNARFVFNGEDAGTLRIPWKDWGRFVKVLNAGAKHTYEQYLTETRIVGVEAKEKEVVNGAKDTVLDKKVPQGDEAGQVRGTAGDFSDFAGVVPSGAEKGGGESGGVDEGAGGGEGEEGK